MNTRSKDLVINSNACMPLKWSSSLDLCFDKLLLSEFYKTLTPVSQVF